MDKVKSTLKPTSKPSPTPTPTSIPLCKPVKKSTSSSDSYVGTPITNPVDVNVWIYNKEKETKLSNLPVNSQIKENISKAQEFKASGKFSFYWDYEDIANRMILDLLFKKGNVAESSAFSSKMGITQEISKMIQLESKYIKANEGMNTLKLSIDDAYYSDLQKYGKPTAIKNKTKNVEDKKSVSSKYEADIDKYGKELIRVNTELSKDRLLEHQREELRKKAEADRRALENRNKVIIKETPVESPMEIYMKNKIRADTANELNESTMSTYKHDLIYLFFKILLFVVLGVVFYFFMKDQNPKEMLTQAKETTKVLSDTVSDGVKTIKETVKEKGTEMLKEIKTKSPDLK